MSTFDPKRRELLKVTAATGSAVATAGLVPRDAASAPGTSQTASAATGAVTVMLRVNGTDHTVMLDPRTSLLDALRERLHLTGTKKGCDQGQCGACTVIVDDRRITSCLTLAVMQEGHEITTIEGLGTPDALHPMQAAFVACDGYQCGYCTSGQIMSAVALLNQKPRPTDDDIDNAMNGNICRCATYTRIRQAIHKAASMHGNTTAAPQQQPFGSQARDSITRPLAQGASALFTLDAEE